MRDIRCVADLLEEEYMDAAEARRCRHADEACNPPPDPPTMRTTGGPMDLTPAQPARRVIDRTMLIGLSINVVQQGHYLSALQDLLIEAATEDVERYGPLVSKLASVNLDVIVAYEAIHDLVKIAVEEL